MSTSTAVTGVEHAPVPPASANRDRIVLSADEVRAAYDAALTDPLGAVKALTQRDMVDARSRARIECAADVALSHGLALPAARVSHTTTVTRRTPSPVVQLDPDGNKFVEHESASTGGFRVAFVEREDGADVHPMVTCDIDAEYDERNFAVMVAHLNELVREMDPTGSLRAAGERAVQR